MKELLVFNINPLALLINPHTVGPVSTVATLGTEESGHCGEVAIMGM